jgi:hypothetical protein
VDKLVDTSSWQYAVINVRSDPDRERLVIAYPDEETLKDLIATSSIVALGYTSRADAVKNVNCSVTAKTSVTRPLKTASCHPNMSFLTDVVFHWRRLAGGFGRSGISGVMRNLLHNALAVTFIFLYSKNVLSSTARAFICF